MSVEVTLPIHVRDLTYDDLPHCAWSGSPLHLLSVEAELDRVAAGAADYLAVCAARSDRPLAIGGVDYEQTPAAGTIHQLATMEALRSCGLGTALITAAENRIRRRGVPRAELGVELDNPRARALYERLGYVAFEERPDAWDEQAPDGTIRRYETVCTIMAKDLRVSG
jgi:ribosomal protein S18 acetylase RimI-like enzyme